MIGDEAKIDAAGKSNGGSSRSGDGVADRIFGDESTIARRDDELPVAPRERISDIGGIRPAPLPPRERNEGDGERERDELLLVSVAVVMLFEAVACFFEGGGIGGLELGSSSRIIEGLPGALHNTAEQTIKQHKSRRKRERRKFPIMGLNQ